MEQVIKGKLTTIINDQAIIGLIERQVYWDKKFDVESIANACDINFYNKYPDMTIEDWKKLVSNYQNI